jgi:hypothetical protein
MTMASAPANPLDRWTARNLAHPATLALVGSNAVPIIGLVFWRWDAFVLLLGYWMETAVIAFWTFVRIAARLEEATADTKGPRPGPVRRVFILAAVLAFVGLFMAVQFEIIREAFGAAWRHRAASRGQLAWAVLWEEGVWVAVLAVFLGRGVTCLLDLLDPVRIRRWILAIWPDYPGVLPGDRKVEPGTALIGLGARIVLMQVAILVGGFVAVKIGMAAPVVLPLILLVVIKSYIELSLHIADMPAPGT